MIQLRPCPYRYSSIYTWTTLSRGRTVGRSDAKFGELDKTPASVQFLTDFKNTGWKIRGRISASTCYCYIFINLYPEYEGPQNLGPLNLD